MEQTFSMKEALQFGWKQTQEKLWFLAGVVVIIFIVNFLPQFLVTIFRAKDTFGEIIIFILFWIVSLLIQLGVMKIMLSIVDGAPVSYKDLFSESKILPQFFIAAILAGLLVSLGMILLVIPGIIAAISTGFFGYIILDKNISAIQAIKESWRITKGNRWKLLGLGIVMSLINMLGFLLFFVGLLWTVPTTMIAYAYVYRKLSGGVPVTSQVVPASPAPAPTGE